MGVRLCKKFQSALVDTASQNPDQTTPAQITPAQPMRKAATARKDGRPRDLMDPAFMNPEQKTSTPTKQDLLHEEIQ